MTAVTQKHAGGRPRKPTALKKKQGTYRKDRDKNTSDVQIATTSMIIHDASFSVPKSITTEKAKQYYLNLVNGLQEMGVLSGADLPQIEQLCLYLQKLDLAAEQFNNASVFDEDFDAIEQRYSRLVNQFDKLAQKYYISPVARSKIRLDELTIKDKELSVAEKEKSAVSKLLAARGK